MRRGRLADARDVVQAVSGPVPALTCVAGSCPAGCEAQGKAQGRPFRPGVTGEGKTERVNVSEPVVMPRYGNSPRRVVLAGMIRSELLRIGRRRPRTLRRSYGHRCSRGTGGTRPGHISCVRNVETPSGPSHPYRRGGRPTAREAESRGGNRTPKKRMPAAERQREHAVSRPPSSGAGPR